MFQILVYFLRKNCKPQPLKKPPPRSQQLPLKIEVLSIPLLPPPLQQKGGSALCYMSVQFMFNTPEYS